MTLLLLLSLFNTYALAWCAPSRARLHRQNHMDQPENYTHQFSQEERQFPDSASRHGSFLPELESAMNNTDSFVKGNVTWDSLQEVIDTATATKERSFHELQKNHRESLDSWKSDRNKKQRLNSIKNQILTYLGLEGRTPTVNVSQLPSESQMQEIYKRWQFYNVPHHSEVYTERVQTFYPSCDVPRNTDAELWNGRDSFHLYFDLSYPKTQEGTRLGIIAAKLKLFKMSQDVETAPPAESEPCTPSEEISGQQTYLGNGLQGDSKVRVSVYWYTRSLKKHRDKKKLLDSLMLSVYGDERVEFDIRNAVRSWYQTGKNFGLVLEVEDEDKNIHPPSNFFKEMNCSDGATFAHPFPSFLVDVVRRNDRGNITISLYQNMFPMVDLVTVELPEDGTEVADDSPLFYLGQRKPNYFSAPNPLLPQPLFTEFNGESSRVGDREAVGTEKKGEVSLNVNSDGVTTIPILQSAQILYQKPWAQNRQHQIQHTTRNPESLVENYHPHRHSRHHTETHPVEGLDLVSSEMESRERESKEESERTLGHSAVNAFLQFIAFHRNNEEKQRIISNLEQISLLNNSSRNSHPSNAETGAENNNRRVTESTTESSRGQRRNSRNNRQHRRDSAASLETRLAPNAGMNDRRASRTIHDQRRDERISQDKRWEWRGSHGRREGSSSHPEVKGYINLEPEER